MSKPRRTVADLARENAQLREYIAASKECAEARAAAEYERLYNDLRARCTKALDDITEGAVINIGSCPFCGESWPTVDLDREQRAAIAAEHDGWCEKNPIRLERDAARAEVTALRRALIHIADLQLRRRRDLNEVWAFREVANDLSEPFSPRRVDAEIERYTEEDRRK